MDFIKGVNPDWEKLVSMKNKLYRKAFLLCAKMKPRESPAQKPGEFLPLEQLYGDPKQIRTAKKII